MIDGSSPWPESHHCVRLRVDAWEDSDGDGVFNIQELMIGKNPANPRDVLGIRLVVATDWIASDDFVNKVANAFRKASNAIYDYTDGYAFISEIKIMRCDGQTSEFLSAHVRIYEDKPFGAREAALVAGYWVPAEWRSSGWCVYLYKDTFGIFGQAPAVIAHELGHYVFCFYDEYEYLFWFDTRYEEPVPIYAELPDSVQLAMETLGYTSLMGFGCYVMPHYDEISTYEHYMMLTQLQYLLPTAIFNNITAQWYEAIWRGYRYGFCWYTLVAVFTDGQFECIVYDPEPPPYDVYHFFVDVHSLIFYLDGYVISDVANSPNVDSILLAYEPLGGPYTSVGLYLRAIY